MAQKYLVVGANHLFNSINSLLQSKEDKGYKVIKKNIESFGRNSIIEYKNNKFSVGYIGYDWIRHSNEILGGWHMRAGDKYLVADIDGDGKDELVVISPSSSNGDTWIGVLKEDGGKLIAGSIVKNWIHHSNGNGGWHMRAGDKYLVADIDGDGKDELVVVSPNGQWLGLIKYISGHLITKQINNKTVETPNLPTGSNWKLYKDTKYIIGRFDNPTKHKIFSINLNTASCESIRQYILDIKPQYLLLLGDSNLLPGYTLERKYYNTDKRRDDSYLYESDSFFIMKDSDNYPTIPFGRLSSNSALELGKICTTILNYPVTTGQNWQKRIILTGFLPPWKESTDPDHPGWSCPKVIDGKFEIIKEYEHEHRASGDDVERLNFWGANDSTLGSLIARINTGTLIVQYFGHGGCNSWGNIGDNESFNSHNITNDISVGDRIPLILSLACRTGRISMSKSFAEEWQTQGKAIGVFASDWDSALFWNARITPLIYKQILNEQEKKIGKVLINAMADLNSKFHHDDFCKHTFKLYRYFGDPDTDLATN